jgi:2-dehydropantoate 2-reductase
MRAVPAQTTSLRPQRVLVVGCGGIGGTLVCRLLEAGVDVTVVTTNASVRHALVSSGPSLGGRAPLSALPEASVLASLRDYDGQFDFVILAVQPPEVERAALDVRGVLSPEGRVVCLQNGLCEERIAPLIGPDRVVGGVVAWGASMTGPGRYEQTSAGGITVGYLDGHEDSALVALGDLLARVGPTSRTNNLRGARWSKLAINCAVSTLGTLGGERLGPLLARGFVRNLALEILTECVAVARADGIVLEPIATTVDLDWLILPERDGSALSRSAALAARHALLLAVGARYRRMRSSMLAAIERGRTPAVDFLNGEVVERGRRLGIETPVNARAQRMVWEMSEGRRLAGLETLRELAATARSPEDAPSAVA